MHILDSKGSFNRIYNSIGYLFSSSKLLEIQTYHCTDNNWISIQIYDGGFLNFNVLGSSGHDHKSSSKSVVPMNAFNVNRIVNLRTCCFTDFVKLSPE